MEIHGSRDGFILLTPLFGGDQSEAGVPALYCSCAMAAHRFAGATEPDEPIIRIDMAQLRRFVEDVRILERDRRGEATLSCPQLQLSLSIYDRAGHVRLAAALTDHQLEGDHHVALIFEVDPTGLPGILMDLEELLAFPGLQTSTGPVEP